MRSRWMLAATVVAGAWLVGPSAYAQTSDAQWLEQCRKQDRDRRFRHCEVRPVNQGGGGRLVVDARPNGGVQVTGWDQGTVSGSARIQVQAETEADARAIANAIVVDNSTGSLQAHGPKTTRDASWSVSYVISAPRRTDLQIESVNGPISITGVHGEIRATTTNGPISLEDLGGDVRARATNGPLTVALAGSSWDGVGLDAETSNGPLRLMVPDGYSAQLKIGTVNGPFRLGIPVTVQGEIAGRRAKWIDAAIGSGGAPIRAVTTNGPASVNRR